MKPSNLVVVLELLLLAGAGAVSFGVLPHGHFEYLDNLWFFLGIAILTYFDVWLPRGDPLGMSSALILAAMLQLNALSVVVILLAAQLVTLAPRPRMQMWRSALGAITAKSFAVVACSALLVSLGLHPILAGKSAAPLPAPQLAVVFLLGLAFTSLEFVGVLIETAVRTNRPIRASVLGGLSFGLWLVTAQASAGVLAALVYRSMGLWGLGIIAVLILVMRQSFSLLLEIRQAYNSTIDVLVRALEAQRPGREGRADTTAELATRIGRECGLHGGDLERLRYAALLLELGGEEGVEAAPDSSVGEEDKPGARAGAARIIQDVEFLKDVLPVLSLCDAPTSLPGARRTDVVCAYIASLASTVCADLPCSQLQSLRARLNPRIVREVQRAMELVIDEEPRTQVTPVRSSRAGGW